MKRRDLMAAAALPFAAGAAPARPNILILHCHDLGQFLGCYGIKTVHTPNLDRFAESVALRIASGTSRALPEPSPTRPFLSPTTTSAAKAKRRPPFTTLATRLIATSLSTSSSPSRSRRSPRSRPSCC